jgi:hypothetical protein
MGQRGGGCRPLSGGIATTHGERPAVERWVEGNQEAVAKALGAARDDLSALLGGQPDPERQREALAAEVAQMRLTMKRRRRP